MENTTQLLWGQLGNLGGIVVPRITIVRVLTVERVQKKLIVVLEQGSVVIRTSTNDVLYQSVGFHMCLHLLRDNGLTTEVASEFSLIVYIVSISLVSFVLCTERWWMTLICNAYIDCAALCADRTNSI